MTGVNSYSTTASENISSNTGINWDEGMPPASVNNSARQNMADMRAAMNDLIWFQYGIGSKTVAAVYGSGTSFTLAGADATAAYHNGRPVRAVGATTGTIYGCITNSAYAASTTTVTVEWDSGALSNETLAVYLSQAQVTGNPIRGPIRFPATQVASSNVNTLDDYEEGTWTPTLLFGGAGAGINYAANGRNGTYTKIGNTVFVRGYFKLTSKGSSVGGASVNNLPFANNSAAYAYTALDIFAYSLGTIANPTAVLAPSSSGLLLYSRTAGATTLLADTDFTDASELVITGQYQV